MSDELVTIEVDGKSIQARKGAMLIEATDASGIYIPRFCYHKKLSIAANCRMCLVQVDKAAKPLPACATPVMDGMKVKTRSDQALEAQKATMEFLLINHPLDCPICDQGGECELQDLAMGYGSDVSRYSEKKRVVKDKNIGPLIQTDMTRCIHCTRCVRFGDEIAGLRELGGTGRGENLQIGTYVEKTVSSEMSGNVIDLCPVGALTSKPFRFSARAWELRQKEGIAPHDSIGSNIYFHIKNGRVKRVVPRENEAINEVWISDRDRFSYEGLHSEDRLIAPMIKQSGQWRETDWETALAFTAGGLKEVLSAHGPAQVGALASPSATVEELFLLQKLMRGLGSHNVDHRLRQTDFSDQEETPLFPWLGQSIAEIENADAVLLVGTHVRKEQPIVNHRLRKAARHGAQIMAVNSVDYGFNFILAEKAVVPPSRMVETLAGIAKALLTLDSKKVPDDAVVTLLADVIPDVTQVSIAERLKSAGRGCVLLGNLATAHPQFSLLRALAGIITKLAGARLGYLAEAANSSGAWLAGAVPHRGPGGQRIKQGGLNTAAMLDPGLRAYMLLGLEPELDCINPHRTISALSQADFVVSLAAFRTPLMESYADVLLPIALFAETSGSYFNAAGQWQGFQSAVSAPGQTRPGWKVLRVLGNLMGVSGFDYLDSDDVTKELLGFDVKKGALSNEDKWILPKRLATQAGEGIELITEVPMHRIDALVRRAASLQSTSDAGDNAVHLCRSCASRLSLEEGQLAWLRQGENMISLPVMLDDRVPENCAIIYGAQSAVMGLNPGDGWVELAAE
jgi:NADH-quinone oxidoreductase subunit G